MFCGLAPAFIAHLKIFKNAHAGMDCQN